MGERIQSVETGDVLKVQSLNSHALKCNTDGKTDEFGQEEEMVAVSSVESNITKKTHVDATTSYQNGCIDAGKNECGRNTCGDDEKSNIESTSVGKTGNLGPPEDVCKPAPAPVPTDEYGRELSAYEIMRLERIRRNQAKLAQLGLENALRKVPVEERKKKVKKRSSTSNTESCEIIERRRTMSRKSKIKEVNYSDDVKPIETEMKDEKKAVPKVAKTSQKKKKLDQTVPLCIYREMKRVSRNRRHELKTAEKNLRYAETEYRFAKRQVDTLDRKERRKRQKEERIRSQQQAAEENRVIILKLQEVEKRLWEIALARDQAKRELNRKEMIAKENESAEYAENAAAKLRFPEAMRGTEKSLDLMLRERLPFMEKKTDKDEVHTPALKRKFDPGKTNDSSYDVPLSPSPSKKKISHENSTTALESTPIQSNDLQLKVQEKTKRPKARNVGGPISPKFSQSLQRKWLEGDNAVAPSAHTQLVPQVGDTILYYPSAHYEFLNEYPDIRCQKGKLVLRKPLWLRARDENEGSDNCDNKRKKKIWWTEDWVSSICFATGSYPIICRVDRTIPEFPHDKEAEEEAKKQKSKKKPPGSEQRIPNENVAFNGDGGHTDQSPRRSSRRIKSYVGLSVTLRPLTRIIPPTRSKNQQKDKTLFEEEVLALPPLFSVLTFPSERGQFLIPFSWAYRSSLSLSAGDRVKTIGGCIGTIISNGNHESCITNSTFEFLEEVIQESAKIEISDTHKLDKFISDSYTIKKSNTADCLLPEADLRAVVQVILFQQYKRKVAPDEMIKDTVGALKSCDPSPNAPEIINGSLSVSNLFKWIQMTLPRWKGAKVLLEHNNTQCEISPWSLTDLETKKNESFQNDTLVAALAPSVLISSSASNNGGMIYNIDERLRIQIEHGIKKFIDTHAEAAMFVPAVTDKIAPGYSCYVPHAISFRKIMTRLKVRQMKFLKEQRHHSDDPTLQQAMENTHCCYYRSIGAILSDLSQVYHNCLIYNDPNSDIVLGAELVTSKVKSLVEKLESRWVREMKLKEKEEREAARNAALVAHGKDCSTSFPNRSSMTIESETYGVVFNGKLNRDWIEEIVNSDGNNKVNAQSFVDARNTRLHWTPQCGDKILYNRQMHGRFVNGHFSSLTKEQRILPHVLPKKNATKSKHVMNSSKESEHCSESEQNGSHYWMLGTVQWVKAVFPSFPSNPAVAQVESFDVASPLLAIGIKFHYNWLSGINVVYWRPCEILAKHRYTDNKKSLLDGDVKACVPCTGSVTVPFAEIRSCKQCNLSLNLSFIYPAWIGNNEQILPPFPLSLSRLQPPISLPDKDVLAIDNCFEVLKRRCVEKKRLDSFDSQLAMCAFDKLFNLLPEHIKSIVIDSEDENELPSGLYSEEMTHDTLCQVHFFPPWRYDRKEPIVRGIPTRTKFSPSIQKNDDPVVPLHEAIMPFPNLSLDLIQKRFQNGYYRSRQAAAHDIREAFVSSIFYYLKKKAKVRYISEESSRRVLEELFRTQDIALNPAEDRKEVKVCLSTRETRLLQHLLIVRKLHSSALISVLETTTAEIAYGLKKKQQFREEYSLNEERKLAVRQADFIVASFLPEPPVYRTRSESMPTIKVLVKIRDLPLGDQSQIDSSNVNLSQPIILEPKDYEGNEALVSAILCVPNRKKTCAKCRMCKYSLLGCRIRKAHCNIDFHHWLKYLEGVGGVDGLMKLLNPLYVPPITNFVPMKPLVAVMHGQTQGPLSTAYLQKSNHIFPKLTDTSQRQVLDYQNVQAFDARYNQPDISYGKKDELILGKSCIDSSNQAILADKSNSVALGHNANAINETSTKLDQDKLLKKMEETKLNLNEVLRKSELALRLARDALDFAKELMESKRLLSDEFIRGTFHIDPNDGHYLLCVVCGLGGDVLCCETCATVCHYKCADLSDVPTGDWYCGNCVNHSKNVSELDSTNPINKLELGNADCNDLDKDNDAKDTILRNLLEELRCNRLKESRDDSKIESRENGKEEVTVTPALIPKEEKDSSEKDNVQENVEDPSSNQSIIDTGHDKATSSINVEEVKVKVTETEDVIAAKNTASHNSKAKHGETVEVGTRIRKQFDKVFYAGTIVALPSSSSEYFKVEYEDGDEEDLSEDELLDLICFDEEEDEICNDNDNQRVSGIPRTLPKTPPINNELIKRKGKRKRGRPRKNAKQEDPQPVKESRLNKNQDALKIRHHSAPGSAKKGRGRPRKIANVVSSKIDSLQIKGPSTDQQGNTAAQNSRLK